MAELKDYRWTIRDYERAAEQYLANLPLEHFMEGVQQSTQRKITSESFDVLRTFLPDLQLYSELLIQYFHKGKHREVVPDHFARRCTQPTLSLSTFILEREPVPPLLAMEYVSPRSQRKDYKLSFRKYERELKVPYCLLFDHVRQDLKVFHHNGTKYEPVEANAQGRLPLPELELEIGLLDGWVRFWFRGQLLELPDELLQQISRERQEREREQKRADRAERLAEQEKQHAEQEKQRAEQERQQRIAAEAEVARLRALLEQRPKPAGGAERSTRAKKMPRR